MCISSHFLPEQPVPETVVENECPVLTRPDFGCAILCVCLRGISVLSRCVCVYTHLLIPPQKNGCCSYASFNASSKKWMLLNPLTSSLTSLPTSRRWEGSHPATPPTALSIADADQTVTIRGKASGCAL